MSDGFDTPQLGDEQSAADPARADGSGTTDHYLPLVYEELRVIAAAYLENERRGHTLQPTAVVHEAYLRLSERDVDVCRDENHFLAIAARSMRQVLVDHARTRQAARRGGGRLRVALDDELDVAAAQDVDLLALDQLIERLESLHERQARVVELRFFSGLSVEQTAKVLEVSVGTIERDWRFARTWLRLKLEREDRPTPHDTPPLATPAN